MSTLKANQYLNGLDAARCNGQWDSVKELVRKVRKHATGRRCLALVAETEDRLRNLPPPPPESSYSTKNSYIANLNSLRDPLLDDIQSYNLPLPKLPSPAGGGQSVVVTAEDILQARITISWISSLKNDWEEALGIVPGEDEVGEGSNIGGKSDYTSILRIKALVLKGIALAHLNPDPSLPLQLYRAATRLPAMLPETLRNFPAFAQWAEKAMAHYCVTAYLCWQESHAPPSTPTAVTAPSSPENGHRDGEESDPKEASNGETNEEDTVGMAIGKTIIDDTTVASAFREFHAFVDSLKLVKQEGTSTPARPRTADVRLALETEKERTQVYRHYFKFLSQILLPPTHPECPSPSHLSPSSSSAANPTNNRKRTGTKAGTREQLRAELRQIEQEYEEYLTRGLRFPKADDYHEIIGEWVDQVVENWRVSGGFGDDALPVVEILYRAAQKTFHSPRILRHLFSSLTATGNLQDAMAALNTYFELIQKAKERIAKGNHEKDFDSDTSIFQTAVEGIRVLCRFSNNGQKAMDIATKMEKWIEEWRVVDKDILAEVYRGIGMANACWARQTIDAEARPGAQNMAVDAFKKGLSYDPIDIQGWYGAALVEAELRRTDDAIVSARRGLGALTHHYFENQDVSDVVGNTRDYKRWAVSLLHLLALLMTAKQDFEGAEKVCRNAFDIVGDSRDSVSDLGVADKVAVLELMITHLAITEAVEDSETVIQMAGKLLTLYGILFDGSHLVQRLDVGQSEDNVTGLGSTPSSRPATTASRRSRLFPSGKHKKQFSASYTSLPPPEDTDEPPSRSGTLKKRPKSGHQSLGIPTGTIAQPAAPKIHVTDTNGGAYSPSNRKSLRTNSISGGAIRRMKSLGSIRSKEIKREGSPTPPLPSSTEASSLNFGDREHGGRDPHLFNMLKNKLHHHQRQQAIDSRFESVTSVPLELLQGDGVAESSTAKRETPRTDDTPHNLAQNKLPYPLGAIGRTLPDESGRGRPSKRPNQLPEPKLAIDEERKKVRGGLRKAWLVIAGLYRRAGFIEDAAMALEEASQMIDVDGEGEADVVAEKGFLALEQNRKPLAADFFEQALALDYDHPTAIVGLSKILLDVHDIVSQLSETRPGTPTIDSQKQKSQEDDDEAVMNRLAARDRALGLLETLVASPKGWDLSEAWYLFAEALEQTGELERSESALWKVVQLEDGTGIRKWSSCGVGVV